MGTAKARRGDPYWWLIDLGPTTKSMALWAATIGVAWPVTALAVDKERRQGKKIDSALSDVGACEEQGRSTHGSCPTIVSGKPGSNSLTPSRKAICSFVSLIESAVMLSLRLATLRPPTSGKTSAGEARCREGQREGSEGSSTPKRRNKQGALLMTSAGQASGVSCKIRSAR